MMIHEQKHSCSLLTHFYRGGLCFRTWLNIEYIIHVESTFAFTLTHSVFEASARLFNTDFVTFITLNHSNIEAWHRNQHIFNTHLDFVNGWSSSIFWHRDRNAQNVSRALDAHTQQSAWNDHGLSQYFRCSDISWVFSGIIYTEF